MDYNHLYITFIILINFALLFSCNSIGVDEDITISQRQKAILDRLRDKILPHLEHDYMKTDIYLVRWLRARDFNIDATERMLLDNLQWRKDNKIDELNTEDWSYFEQGFAYSTDSVNKRGQPLLIIDNVKWDVRGVVLQGRREKLIRWMVKMLEDSTKRVMELQDAGHNVTRFSMVNTLENFNLIESGCLQCLSVYTAFTSNYETHYPNMMDQMILVNTPGIFDIVMTLIRPLLSPGTRQSLKLMGTNKQVWQAELRKDIDATELPVDFGGDKETY